MKALSITGQGLRTSAGPPLPATKHILFLTLVLQLVLLLAFALFSTGSSSTGYLPLQSATSTYPYLSPYTFNDFIYNSLPVCFLFLFFLLLYF